MAKTLVLTNTEGSRNIMITPGQLDGLGGSQTSTDLRLYGIGAQKWGEGVNEDLYRLVENFSCPAKQANDYNPVSGSYDYDPIVQGLLPKDANDLGFGRGINNPITGQLWFNTTVSTLYVFDSSVDPIFGWSQSTGIYSSTSAPSATQVGDLWFDTNTNQLNVWDGSQWISTAHRYVLLDGTSTMTGSLDLGSHEIVNVADPSNLQDAATKNYVDSEIGFITGGGAGVYVLVSGSTMTGTLNLDASSGSRLVASYQSSSLTVGNGNDITAGSDIRKTSNMLFSADGNIYTHFSPGNSFRIARGGANRNSGFTDMLHVNDDGIVSVRSGYETLGLTNTSLINKAYFDNNTTATLNELDDVQSSPSDGDVLKYNTSANRWEEGVSTDYVFPAGVIVPFGGGNAPNGWLQCDGSPVSRTTYASLFNNIGTNYGSGDGSTTFNLPDFRGEFLRGWDDGRGVDPGRGLGSFQADEFRSHSHDYTGTTLHDHTDYGNESEYGAKHTTRTTASTGGNETRPRNVTVNYIIKV